MTTVTPAYAVDYTGTSPANLITGEIQVLNSSVGYSFNSIIPEFAPYFAESLVIVYTPETGGSHTLVSGVDYNPTDENTNAARACATAVYNNISFLVLSLNGTVTLQYQTLGGVWLQNAVAIVTSHINNLNNPHDVTAAQLGAITESQLQSAISTAIAGVISYNIGSLTLTGLVAGSAIPIVSANTILQALANLQAQVTAGVSGSSFSLTSELTGFVSGAGTVSDTDTILSAIEKINGNLLSLGTTVGNNSTTISSETTRAEIAEALLVPKTTTINSHSLNSNITLVASDIGLGNVNNTSDVNKPVSTAQAIAIAAVASNNSINPILSSIIFGN